MQPVFTMQYGEFAVADYLSKNINDVSVFIPTSAQEKGIDLLLYRHSNGHNSIRTIQVKMSRTYYHSSRKHPYDLWYNTFKVQDNADWYILVGIFAQHPQKENVKSADIKWETIMLAFTHDEMGYFMSNVKQKKDPTKPDRMFAFKFNDAKEIFQTRGCSEPQNMTQYCIENRLQELANF